MAQVVLTSGVMVDDKAVILNIKRLINQVFKLLPLREEGKDWEKLLETLIEEINGMKRLFYGQDDLFILLLCKMEGLFSLKSKDTMQIYRRVIFECLNLLDNLSDNVCNKEFK